MISKLALSLALSAVQPPAQALSAEEGALTAFVDRENARALALLERIVNINSGTMNLAGVKEVGAALRPEFDALGFKTEWVEGASFGRAGHLIADHPGPGTRILLIGHLDTVFEPDSPFQKFERVSPMAAKGPGTTDMKGGNVRESLAGQPHLTFNPGVIVGGTSVDYDGPASRGTGFGKSNVIAEYTVVTGDVRALSPAQFESAKKTMREIVAASLPRTSATLTFDDGYPPLAPTPDNERLLALYSRASLDVGGGPVIAVVLRMNDWYFQIAWDD
jgi:acetylornithine deacetylase/succinyl-diaminopimelate desuccinylase-like protein